jgi:hypothetical protein
MDAVKLYRLMEDASLLNNETLSELKQLVEDCPCFHAARMLYLKNLAVLNDVKFGTELKKTAIYVPDRKMLYMLIEEVRLLLEEPANERVIEDPFDLIEQFLQDKPGGEPDPGIVLRQPVSSEYFTSLYDMEQPEGNSPPLKNEDLINDFLEEDEIRKQSRRWTETDNRTEYLKPGSIIWLEQNGGEAKSLDDSYFTETLAIIYIRQRRYEKALDIIKNLSLKYPEKNVYFADQIRFLEKLIINTKKHI